MLGIFYFFIIDYNIKTFRHLVSEVNNDDGHEGASHDTNSRLIPRLERRKVSIKRNDVLKVIE